VLLRPVRRPDDLPTLESLFETIAECDGHSPIGEHKYLDLLHSDPNHITGLVGEDRGTPIAYVAVGPTQDSGTWAIEPALHPLHRDRSTTRRLVDAGVGRAIEAGADRVRCWAFLPNLVSVLEDAGFRPERELRQLRVGLPIASRPVFPEDVLVRPFRPGVDEDVWLSVNNAAFAGHPENGAWTEDILEDRKAQTWFDADGFRMAWDGPTLVGFCWTKVHDDGVGEIYVIGVAPEAQGRGLGRALVLEGLRHLADDRHLSRAMLYVDSGNEAALDLYQKLGFRLDHVDRALVREL
jgi:mycothiol synthase